MALDQKALEADCGKMTPEEIRFEDLKQMAAYKGPIVSLYVREPYYLGSCDKCGWVGSTELCGTDSFGDDSDVYCPRCHASGADCGKVAAALSALPAGTVEPVAWRCFHCDEVFTDVAAAREHFGETLDDEPICQVTVERYRAVERELESYRNESDATSRTFYDIGHRAAVAARDAEQKGYDRGLADAKAYPETLVEGAEAKVAALALASGQVEKLQWGPDLYSEDLW